ncbi:MMPL family transporter [Phenylobacterium sp.]|uniref:MMPL family transporter n=1 Tax=Phenylobacterium sp. TaxID=1871053 RepID=UPI00356AAFE8
MANLVAFSCRHARSLVATAAVATLAAAVYVAAHFSVHTELAALIPPDVPWRVQERALEAAFVQQGDDITVVIEGQTPELAEAAAARLSAALTGRTDLYRRVDRPGGGPFFQREGILYISQPEVRATTETLIRAQPLLAPVAADPSLRGVLTSLSTGAAGVAAGAAQPDQLAGALRSVTEAVAEVEQGKPVYFSWRRLIVGDPGRGADARQFIVLYPNSNDGLGGSDSALSTVRAEVRRLALDPPHGVTVRLTGAIPMAAEELATLSEATGFIALAAFAAVLVILYLAVRSPKIVGAIVATVLAGLALTAAFGLAVYGRFNLISVAFMPLFVGLGVDFAIQFCVRYRAEALADSDVVGALVKAGGGTAYGLGLAAAATGLGFFAFLPTRYKGVSELGFIAGMGMAVCLLLVFTLLPALLTLLRARSPAAEIGLPALRSADDTLFARRGVILAATAGLAVASLAISPLLRFDFDPLRLRNPRSESVSTFLAMAKDPETGPDNLDVLTRDLAQARTIATRLSGRPEVRAAITLDSLVPPDQAPKLALLADANLLLDPTVNPFDLQPAPSDADLVEGLGAAAQALRALAAAPAGASVRLDALRLAGLLDTARTGSPALRARLQEALVGELPTALEQVRALLTAEPVALANLPPDLKADWLAADGRARVQLQPAAAHGDAAGIARFVRAVRGVAPVATGTPVAVAQTRQLILSAFRQAGLLSLGAIALLLALTLRDLRAVVLALTPGALSALLTTGSCVLLGQDINLENLIALPLLLGISVSFNIYFVVAWMSGERNLLRSSLARAVIYSALTTGAAFGALGLSQHPGTASMGILLLISLFWTLVATIVVQPVLLRVTSRGG